MHRAALLLIAATVAALTASSARATILITADRGGLLTDYAERFLSARATGEQVVIDGACLSACTLVVGMLPRDKVCATLQSGARVPRGLAADEEWRQGVNSPPASQMMMEVYPADLRNWIVRRGGLTTKMIFLQGRELAAIVPSCGTSVIASRRPMRPTSRTSSGRIRLAPHSSRGKRDSKSHGGGTLWGTYKYSPALTGIKSFYRLSDGLETLFLVNREGTVLDIVEIDRYVKSTNRADPVLLDVPCPTPYRHHAMATSNNRNICLVLTPSHEIKVFGQGVEMFSFRNARWHLLDVQAKYEMWERAVENEALASRLFQAALDLSDARHGALFVVLRDASTSMPLLVAPGDRLDAPRGKPGDAPDRVQLLHMLRGRTYRSASIRRCSRGWRKPTAQR